MLTFLQIFIPLLFLGLCLKRIELALYLLIIELVWGGAGGRWLPYSYNLSIRIILLAIFFGVWIIKLFLGKVKFKLKDKKLIYFILIFALAYPLLFGGVMHLIYPKNISYLINDGNGWMFYLIALPMINIIDSTRKLWRLIRVYFVSILLLGAVLSLIYFASALNFINIWQVQKLLLEQGLEMGGKVGIMPDGALRVFLGSSIFLPFAVFMLLSLRYHPARLRRGGLWSKLLSSRIGFNVWKLASLTLLYFALIASYTRGLWIGAILGLIFFLLWVDWKKRMKIVTGLFVLFFLTQIIFQGIFHTSFINVFLGRMVATVDVKKDPVSVGARVSQIKILGKHILQYPLFGTGFGTVIPGYREEVAAPFSFELGYLDMMVKFGLLGFVLWVFFICYILFKALQILWFNFQISEETRMILVALLSSVLTLLFVSGTSPFISSSFGILQILLLMSSVVLLQRREK